MLYRILIAVVVASGSIAPTLAQRIFASVEPDEAEELRFDVNNAPLLTTAVSASDELNFSPNVVFTPDSSKAFVSFPGSGKVMVFRPQDGEILALIEVGDNPAMLTLSPDGTKVGVVSLFLRANIPQPGDESFEGQKIGSISLIDAETFEVRTLELSEVFFSFANNIVFSADGQTGFVASAGTDQVLRFDVESLAEISPRIQFDGGTRPTSLSMDPNFEFFTVVLVGSAALPIAENPDSIQIVDPDTFQVTRSIVPDPTEVTTSSGSVVRIPHNFRAVNVVALSSDGKLGLIADQENSMVSFLPEFTDDHALLLDLEEGTLKKVFSTGGVAGATAFSAPQGLFVAVSVVDVTIIDPVAETSLRSALSFVQYRSTSRPAFSADGRIVFVGSPIDDLLSVFDIRTAIARNRVDTAPDFVSTSPFVAAGTLDLAMSPDGKVLTALNFNANTIDLFKNTFRFAVPQLIAQNIDTIESEDGTEEPEVIPASERFFSGIAVSNFGDQDADVMFTAFGSLTPPAETDLDLMAADPNPIPVCGGATLGQTTISWDATGVAEAVEIRVDSVEGTVLATGDATGSVDTGESVTDGMVFYLLDQTSGEVLDSVTVTFTKSDCPPPVIEADPNPIQVCDDGGLGQTTLFWDATGIAEELEIRVGSAGGSLLTQGGPTGSAGTGTWVREGMIFYLLDQSNGEVLDSVAVTLTEQGCPLLIREILEPDEQVTYSADDFLRTNTSLEPPFGDFDGWVDLDSDEPSLAGIFLTYDGEINRIDGGLISSDTFEVAVLPEVRISDGFSTQIEVVNSNVSTIDVQFDLFDSSGVLVSSSLQTLLGSRHAIYRVVGDPNDPSSVGLFDDVVGTILIAASPNPIQVCDEGALGRTTISWNTTGIAETVEIRIGSVDGSVLTTGGASGSFDTGESVTDGTIFYLLDQTSGEVLDSVLVTFTQSGCPPPAILASPNPILVCDGGGLGQTTISWDATGFSEQVEIRVGSVDGSVLSSGGATGSVETGRWVGNGSVFYLLDRVSGEVLDRVTVWLTERGCPLPDFEDGYIRVASSNLVGFESFVDSKRMAVLSAQPLVAEATHFTIPQFIAFGGSDTTLKLIHPSTIPIGGFADEQEEGEYEEGDPIIVSASLRDDDGNPIGQPVELELRDGESLRSSVIDLFQLANGGTIQSGWIEITADRPGLVGSAEIQAFEGEALSAIPLQPLQNSKAVFPHVAQALGYSTGLAVVNPGQDPAQVTLELRKSDSQLVGILGPVTVEPGHRLVGTVPDLFPGAGTLFGGTIKVLSDNPVTSLELFYTEDLRVLSTVPSVAIE